MNQDSRNFVDRLVVFVATGFGAGWLPVAPGTWGSAVGIAAAWGLNFLPWEFRIIAAVSGFLVGIPLCSRAARLLGTADDPGAIVFDEIVGVIWTLLFVPFGVSTAILGFLLFRLFDTTKPWPIRRFEKLHGGLGVMADDLAAALAAGGILWVVAQVFGTLSESVNC
ncbi:MAG: phosphatidylglycerophosphatase A [Planctomycetota bacterium]|nr:phosphatidylglycerophosphatase A [Planctomycetota bacterium]